MMQRITIRMLFFCIDELIHQNFVLALPGTNIVHMYLFGTLAIAELCSTVKQSDMQAFSLHIEARSRIPFEAFIFLNQVNSC